MVDTPLRSNRAIWSKLAKTIVDIELTLQRKTNYNKVYQGNKVYKPVAYRKENGSDKITTRYLKCVWNQKRFISSFTKEKEQSK